MAIAGFRMLKEYAAKMRLKYIVNRFITTQVNIVDNFPNRIKTFYLIQDIMQFADIH